MGHFTGDNNRSDRKVNKKVNIISRTIDYIYKLSYVMGINTVRSGRRAKKRVCRFFVFFSLMCFDFALKLAAPLYKRFVYPHVKRVLALLFNVKTAFSRMGKASKKGLVPFVSEFLRALSAGYKRYKRPVFTLINWAAPMTAVVALVFVVNGWFAKDYALAVVYNGEEIAYVSDETVFNEAANLLMGRVITGNYDFELATPKLVTVEAKPENLITSEKLCDKLIVIFGNEIQEGVGLYIDNVFVGAVTDYDKLTCALGNVLSENLTGTEGERAEFDNSVESLSGFFPADAIVPVDDLVSRITGNKCSASSDGPLTLDSSNAKASGVVTTQLKLFNSQLYSSSEKLDTQNNEPVLKVRIARLETYEKKIPFKVQENSTTNYYEGYKKVTVKGKDGVESITDEVVYLDGVEVSRNNVNRVVVKEPVNEQVTIGKRKVASEGSQYANVKGNGIVTGKFGLPIIGYGCNSGYRTKHRPNHTGMDFASPRGTNILAADGGVVQSVKYQGSYGLHIVIKHDNGYSTLYAHMSKTYVVAGQKVSKGQVIGGVGSTGRSTGNHLHFEIRINNTPVNPAPYLGIPNGK